MRLARFTIIAGLSITGLAGGLAAYNQVASAGSTALENRLTEATIGQLIDSSDLVAAVARVKLDVVQVQQWLTDISATRGLDGLNDGLELAAHYANAFESDIAVASGIAAKLDQDDIAKALQAVQISFAPYYSTGQRMAAAYIENGPQGGNAIMGDFDATAEAIGTAVDAVQTRTDSLASATHAAAATQRAEIQALQQRQTILQSAILTMLIGAIIAMTGFVSGYVFRRLQHISIQLTRVAGGDYSERVYGSRLWDELGNIGRAADVFRENGLKLEAMRATELEQSATHRAARAEMMRSLQSAFGDVVSAAVAGDFSRRVPTNFADAELNSLAHSVNELVDTVDHGLSETGNVLASLSRYDLTKRMSGHYQGAFAKLRDDTEAVAEQLGAIVGKLVGSSQALRTATGEILAGATDLADRTSRSAAAVEQTSAAIEQLTGTVSDNAQRAEAAVRKVRSINQSAEKAGSVMLHANAEMERISASSAKISTIIGVIDDIAFQTNLLALNASVEAARAGDAGKGFAVVAVEVRRLAQSAASASADVKLLIEQSSAEVSSGTRFVAEASGEVNLVLEDIRQSNALIEGIARASQEQASNINEVSTAIHQIDEMTQHNAALVEQTNAAIAQTERQVSELDRIVDVFVLSDAVRPASGASEAVHTPKAAVRRVATYRTAGNAAISPDWNEF